MAQLQIYGGTIRLPSGIVSDDSIAVSSGQEIDADKLQHLYTPATTFNTVVGDTPTTKECLIWLAPTAGTIRSFKAMLVDTGTSTSITFDLKKNGSTVLSSPITIAHTDTDAVALSGTISGTSFAAGDRLTVAMTVSSSTGALGPFAQAEVECRGS